MTIAKLDQFLTEIEKTITPTTIPGIGFMTGRRLLHTTLWTLDAICEMSMKLEIWTADPRGLLTQLLEELEPWEESRWGNRIRRIREAIEIEI
jgi:hypothetical protein